MNEITSNAPAAVSPESSSASPAPDLASAVQEQRPIAKVEGPVRPRLWPAALSIALQWIVLLLPRFVDLEPDAYLCAMIGPAVGFFGFMTSWLFFSRIPWRDRWLGVAACLIPCVVAALLCDSTFLPIGIAFFAPPIVLTVWLLWFVATPFLTWQVRRVGLAVVMVLAWSCFPLLYWEGVRGAFWGEVGWRWNKVVDVNRDPLLAGTTDVLKLQPGDWPAFRGPRRDGRLLGAAINADWEKAPPKLLWRKPAGKAWSSFTVIGKRVYTQEQAGDKEEVTCFDSDTGKILWNQGTPGRFYEQLADAGPRATPTFHDSRIYVMGAMGILSCYDAASGKPIWSTNVKEKAGAKVPTWGYSSSPLVADGVVTVYGGNPDGKALLGFNAASGDLVWEAGHNEMSYCSPQLARIAGVDQILLTSEKGLESFSPARGQLLWKHDWDIGSQVRVVQPSVIDDSTVILGTGMGKGTRQLKVQRKGDAWDVAAGWTTRAINPHYNDFVVHKGHIYGFDGPIFTCVDLENGKRGWRERGYGNGQVLLLADQDLLLILSEDGDVALVKADPASRQELPGRFHAVTGKTWNHPVIAQGRLFVRNAVEIACYELDGYKLAAPAPKKD